MKATGDRRQATGAEFRRGRWRAIGLSGFLATALAFPLVTVVGCGSTNVSTEPAAAGPTPPSPSAASGERIWRQKCGGCHRLYEPSTRTAQEWAKLIDEMAGKAKLSAEQKAELVAFLAANARGVNRER